MKHCRRQNEYGSFKGARGNIPFFISADMFHLLSPARRRHVFFVCVLQRYRIGTIECAHTFTRIRPRPPAQWARADYDYAMQCNWKIPMTLAHSTRRRDFPTYPFGYFSTVVGNSKPYEWLICVWVKSSDTRRRCVASRPHISNRIKQRHEPASQRVLNHVAILRRV